MKVLTPTKKKKFAEIGRAKIENILFLVVGGDYSIKAYNKITGRETPIVYYPNRQEVWIPNRKELKGLEVLEKYPVSKLKHLSNTEFAASHPELFNRSLEEYNKVYHA